MTMMTRSVGVAAILTAAGLATAQPVIDGSLDAIYGGPRWVQNFRTGFGNATNGDPIDGGGGSELNAFYAYIDRSDANDPTLYMFFAGNLEANYNKFEIFIDSIPGEGQNSIRNDNVEVAFDTLGRMGQYSEDRNGDGDTDDPEDLNQPGLTFDTGVAPDYFLNLTIGGSGTPDVSFAAFSVAATLPTNGAERSPTDLILDWGAEDGGDIGAGLAVDPDARLISFDGPDIDFQDGFATSLLTNYAPGTLNRLIDSGDIDTSSQTAIDNSLDVGETAELSNALAIAFDNSNTGGVSGTTGSPDSDPATVDTGIEVMAKFSEIGLDPAADDLTIVAYIAGTDHAFLSNHAIGGSVENNIGGDVRDVNFANVPGNQFVRINLAAGFDLTVPSLVNGRVGDPIAPVTLSATDPSVSFQVIGSLPNGLVFDGVDTISGTPRQPAGQTVVTVRGSLGGADVDADITFDIGNSRADFNEDGLLNLFDILEYFAVFSAGA